MSPLNGAGKMSAQILNTLQDIQREATSLTKGGGASKEPGMSFAEHLQQGIREVNNKSKVSDKMAMELTTGKSGNIHETMLAATQAELSFNLMVQLRNKALEAYSEVMKMPV
jgi:flagellar hook-basal body complex protein FliE